MIRSYIERLTDAREYALAAISAVHEAGFDEVWRLRERRQSLLLDIVLIGEALAKISAEVKVTAPSLPWTEINGTRNRLIHVYWLHERDFISGLIANDLPLLVEHLDRLIGVLEDQP